MAGPGTATETAGLLEVDGFGTPAGGSFSLRVAAGELVLLEGPNGSGKTTLLRCIAGLAPHAATRQPGVATGRFHAQGPVRLVLQDPRDTLVGLTVAGEFRLRRQPVPGPLSPLEDRDVATLSSGEARKVALAAATPAGPGILLLDEPAEGLDAAAKEDLLALVRRALRDGAVLAVDHTGTLAPLASRRVALAAEPAWTYSPIAAANGPTVLQAPAARVRRGTEVLHLPAVALGPGFHVLAGPNGAGKSTLLLRLAGLLGNGVKIADSPAAPGVNVRLLMPRARDLFSRSTVAAELAGIDDAGIVPDALLPRHPLTLSGGEAQRVALAKTLGPQAPVYLLDEPEAHLDGDGLRRMWALVQARVAAGACVLAATHDTRLQAMAQTRIAVGPA